MTKRAPSPSTLHPSFRNSFKSRLYLEIDGWDAAVKIDHDGGNPFSIQRLRRLHGSILAAIGPVRDVAVYRTAKGHHVRIWAHPWTRVVTARAILRIQALLGDDPKRQKFNARRVRRREAGWNVLWNTKLRNGHVVMVETFDVELTVQARKVLVRS